eukprot:TRINITY_DN6549_c0_g1_i1.p1 TRINITY_DN6549_c0_g1~~TRINITY_DN6549_c0_g1_i1.p1  ORF type:complete len:696 (+),score=134.46 TRINITY_DN6549_c0_g1_i1:1828-3915(+)
MDLRNQTCCLKVDLRNFRLRGLRSVGHSKQRRVWVKGAFDGRSLETKEFHLPIDPVWDDEFRFHHEVTGGLGDRYLSLEVFVEEYPHRGVMGRAEVDLHALVTQRPYHELRVTTPDHDDFGVLTFEANVEEETLVEIRFKTITARVSPPLYNSTPYYLSYNVVTDTQAPVESDLSYCDRGLLTWTHPPQLLVLTTMNELHGNKVRFRVSDGPSEASGFDVHLSEILSRYHGGTMHTATVTCCMVGDCGYVEVVVELYGLPTLSQPLHGSPRRGVPLPASHSRRSPRRSPTRHEGHYLPDYERHHEGYREGSPTLINKSVRKVRDRLTDQLTYLRHHPRDVHRQRLHNASEYSALGHSHSARSVPARHTYSPTTSPMRDRSPVRDIHRAGAPLAATIPSRRLEEARRKDQAFHRIDVPRTPPGGDRIARLEDEIIRMEEMIRNNHKHINSMLDTQTLPGSDYNNAVGGGHSKGEKPDRVKPDRAKNLTPMRSSPTRMRDEMPEVVNVQEADTTVRLGKEDVMLGVAGVEYYGHGVVELMEKCYEGDVRFIRKYFRSFKGSSVVSRFFTPLHAVCKGSAHPEAVKILLDVGFDSNAVSSTSSTPLHLLCSNPNPSLEALSLLLQHGASPSSYNSLGMSPLHLAAQNPSSALKLLRFLIYQGSADINQPTEDGRSCLQLCPSYSHPEIHTFLKEGGAR